MNAYERRAEIWRVLLLRRMDDMQNLSDEFDVTDRSVRSDIKYLSVIYPIETVRGKGGGVKVADWYRPYQNTLSRRHQATLIRQINKADELDKKYLLEILMSYGSQVVIKEITGKDSFYEQ